MSNSGNKNSTQSLNGKYNDFAKDQVRRSNEKITYSITVEDGAFEKILDTIKNAPYIKPFDIG